MLQTSSPNLTQGGLTSILDSSVSLPVTLRLRSGNLGTACITLQHF